MKLINNRPRTLLIITLIILFTIVCSQVYAADKFTPIKLNQVKVGGEIGRRIDNTIKNNLLKLDIDNDFLAPFEVKDCNGFNKYIGLGKLIDATVRFAAYTNDPEIIALKKHILDHTIKNQLPDGYIGMFAPEMRMTGFWSLHEMAYMAYGLISDYEYFGEDASLQAARKLVDYIMQNWDSMPPDWSIKRLNLALYHASLGLEESLTPLYVITGEKKYLDFCANKMGLADWYPDIRVFYPSPPTHVYVTLGRILAQLELYKLDPDPKLTRFAKRAIDFMTKQDGLIITGACGKFEKWDNSQDGRGRLGETCATAYVIRFYDKLMQMEGKSLYGDLTERTIYNALFAAQMGDGRQISYFIPFEGARKAFNRDTYCCPNNFRRIMANLPAYIYYRTDKGLAISLYTNSTAEFKLNKGPSVKVKQITDYPTSGKVTISITPEKTAKFPVLLRIPKWCEQAKVSVNGKDVKGKIKSGSFFKINRKWQPGDKIQLDMPMKWRFVRGRKRQTARVALMRGPSVFCLNPPDHKRLANMELADLTEIAIVPDSLSDPIPNDAARPGGIACKIKAWSPGGNIKWGPNLNLVLTEFPDPNGKITYFQVPCPESPEADFTVDDELLGTGPSGGTSFYFPDQ